MENIRQPAVANMFYPGDSRQLREMVRGFVECAPPQPEGVVALIVPHAGYIYSGVTAGVGYRSLSPGGVPRRVILIGPSHRVYLDGVSVGNYSGFATPLGRVTVDRAGVERLATQPDVTTDPAPHHAEHSLEVQLPFLLERLGTFTLIPMVFGRITPARLAELIELVRAPDDLIMISSDLSHYHDYEQAKAVDRFCHQAVVEGVAGALERCEACGKIAIAALLMLAQRYGWRAVLADYRNSGDTAGDKQRVVGYASYLFYG